MPQVVVLQKERHVARIKYSVAAVLALLVLGAAAYGAYVIVSASDFNSVNQRAKALDKAGNYAGEIDLLTSYLAKSPLPPYRYQAAVQLGDVTLRQHSYAAAFRWYFEAQNLAAHPSPQLYADLADSAAGIDDRPTAIGYYQKAIAATAASSLGADDKTTRENQYSNQIRYLEQKH